MSPATSGETWLHPIAYSPVYLRQLVMAGWQTLMVDLERYDLTDEEVVGAIGSIEAAGGKVVARPNEPTEPAMIRCCDGGARRLLLPMIESAGQMRRLNAAIETSFANVELIPLIETRNGLANVAEIAGLPFVGTIMFGPYDLSHDLGSDLWPNVLPQLLPHLLPAFDMVRAAGKRAGFHVLTEWGDAVPFDRLDVLSCAIDDIGKPALSGLPSRFLAV